MLGNNLGLHTPGHVVKINKNRSGCREITAWSRSKVAVKLLEYHNPCLPKIRAVLHRFVGCYSALR